MAVGLVLTMGLCLTVHAADDWPRWRGPGCNGVAGSAVATSCPPRAVKLDKVKHGDETLGQSSMNRSFTHHE